MLSEKNYWRDEVLGCILFNIIVLPTLETVRDICWLANLPEISNTVRTTMQTKMVTSPTTSTIFHPKFLKLLTRFHKKSTHRNLLRTLMYKTQKKIINNRATTHHHAPPQIRDDQRFNPSKLCKSGHQFRKQKPPLDPSAHELQNLKISSPKTAARAATDSRRPAAKSFKSVQICPWF